LLVVAVYPAGQSHSKDPKLQYELGRKFGQFACVATVHPEMNKTKFIINEKKGKRNIENIKNTHL
jgi:hypothetical protein